MLDDRIVGLSKHRLDVAKERLASANVLIDVGDYKAAANRSYLVSLFHNAFF